jgi:hypothetical protein
MDYLEWELLCCCYLIQVTQLSSKGATRCVAKMFAVQEELKTSWTFETLSSSRSKLQVPLSQSFALSFILMENIPSRGAVSSKITSCLSENFSFVYISKIFLSLSLSCSGKTFKLFFFVFTGKKPFSMT